MNKFLSMLTAVACATVLFAGCGAQKGFDSSKEIDVVSREDGSGTRGAFIELLGIEEKNESGEKIDKTKTSAMITNNTSVMMTTVAGDNYAIGYISLGSLSDTVKAVRVDGAEATPENVKNGSYKVARPFNIVTTGNESDLAKDFISFILSKDGQKVIEDNGYIGLDATDNYTAGDFNGTISVAGSSSVTPVMEKLKEAYTAINSSVTIEIQQSDSTTGVSSAVEGVCDIGMASREIKDSEIEKGAIPTVIAKDGIAIIVNNNNTCEELSAEQIKSIYTGDTIDWSFLK